MSEWVKRADSIDGLARAAGLPPDTLTQTVRRWNEMLEAGEDTEWQRFGRSDTNRPAPIATPPFFAVRYFPLARKSMGGVAVDISCRVLDRRGQPIPNLYAVGELAGVGGINGRAALEGTMLGPGILMGRIAAREVVAKLKSGGTFLASNVANPPLERLPTVKATDPETLRPWREVLRQLVAEPRQGYLHFEKAHAVVLERNYDCARCHREPSPLALTENQLDRHALIQACVICHGSVKE